MADQPIPEELRGVMNRVARQIQGAIDASADRPMGFILLAFDFGGGGTTSYISNCAREDCVKLMQEFIDRYQA